MVDMSVTGPPEETEYYLYRPQLPDDQFHELSRTVTKAVLEVSPRAVAEVRVMGILKLLRAIDATAVETLIEGGMPVEDGDGGALCGRCAATPAIVSAVLTLYSPPLVHAHLFDDQGHGIAARYDGHMQHYWLPTAAYPRLEELVSPEAFDALLTLDELEERHEQRRDERR